MGTMGTKPQAAQRRLLAAAVATLAISGSVFSLVDGTRADSTEASVQSSGWWRTDFPLRASGSWQSEALGGVRGKLP